MKFKSIVLVFLFFPSITWAVCLPSVPSAEMIATAILPPNVVPYNKYDVSDYVGGAGDYEVASVAKFQYSTAYTCVPNMARKFKARVTLSERASVPNGEDAYIIPGSSLAVSVKVADYPSSVYQTVKNNEDTLIVNYGGYSNGVKIEVTTYILKGNFSLLNISSLKVADLFLTSTSYVEMSVSKIPVRFTLISAAVSTREYTCSLNQNAYNIALEDISIRNLNTIGQDSTLAPKSLLLSINCPYLQNGGNREIKAYITDGLNQMNTGNILQNTVGSGFSTGVGIRLRDKNNNIIGLDPGQSKTTNKWTFENIGTAQNIQHTIKANYVRTANQVTAGNVEAKALLNIVYD